MRRVRLAFERDTEVLSLQAILPLRSVPDTLKQSSKYKLIARSIAEVGIVEPLVVARQRNAKGSYLLLDGHLRHAVLVDRGETTARCLISSDDEAVTYNKRISRLATIQEHYMIVRAIKRGVSEDKLAQVLNLDVRGIKRRRTMLSGICPEVVEILKDKSVNPSTFDVLRKMKPMRQIQAAQLMSSADNYTIGYARALLAGSRQADLVRPDHAKRVGGLTSEQMARMEREMDVLQHDLKQVESQYAADELNLVIASAYLTKLIKNKQVRRYLSQHHEEILAGFNNVISVSSLARPTRDGHSTRQLSRA